MTAASRAVSLKMQRHLVDAKAREKIVREAAQRASRRLGCACKTLHWDYRALTLQEIHTFYRCLTAAGPGFKPTGLRYLAVLSQSRVFGHLEVFELACDDETFDPSPLRDLATFDVKHGYSGETGTLLVREGDDWDAREHVLSMFIGTTGRRIDITRLTILTGREEPPPPESIWEHQGLREFPAKRGLWLQGPVYEANSARVDKVRTRPHNPDQA